MFKYARLVPYHDCNGFKIIDLRADRQVGEVMRRKKGGYEVYIRGKLIGEASISWEACYVADKYLSAVGSPRKIRKK